MPRQFCGCRDERQPLVRCTEETIGDEGMDYQGSEMDGNGTTGRITIVHLLLIFFGISAWIGVNGIFVQLPLLVNSAPEGWGLPAYLVVLIQAANIGPILYTLSQKYIPKLSESLWISGLLGIGSLAMALLAFFYDRTSVLIGVEHSTAMFVLVFLTALVGCTSSVLFMPYLRDFKEVYLVSYFIGEGLSGFLPSTVALIQGVGGNPQCINGTDGSVTPYVPPPRFPPRDYFLFVFAILASSMIAFWLLECLPVVQGERVHAKSKKSSKTQYEAGGYGCSRTSSISSQQSSVEGDRSKARTYANHLENESELETDQRFNGIGREVGGNDLVSNEATASNGYDLNYKITVAPSSSGGLSAWSRGYLYVLMGLVCLLGNGFLLGIQSYSCLPYGNVAYHLTATLAHMANPAACFLALWILPLGLRAISCLCTFGLITGGYVTWLALMSPAPPLQDTNLGVALVVVAWIALMGLVSYVKLAIATIFRREPGPNALFNIGVVTQAGSACGAVLSFVLINYTALFVPFSPCKNL